MGSIAEMGRGLKQKPPGGRNEPPICSAPPSWISWRFESDDHFPILHDVNTDKRPESVGCLRGRASTPRARFRQPDARSAAFGSAGVGRLRRRHAVLCAVLASLAAGQTVLLAGVSPDPVPPPLTSTTIQADDFGLPAAQGDTIVGWVDPILVLGNEPSHTVDPTDISLDPETMALRDPTALAELGPLLPAARIGVNSRGESQMMVRGAPERHLRVFLDGIPLNVPWDERVDLSLIPVITLGRLDASQGVGSILNGPNALAGRLDLGPLELPTEGRRTRFELRLGEAAAALGRLLHQQRQGRWQWTVAAERRTRDGFLVPPDLDAGFHQDERRLRTNSDLEQTSAELHLAREVGRDGRLRLVLLGFDAEKGVPPEMHLDEQARFWRYPLIRRGLLGMGLDAPISAAERWRLQATVSLDVFRQEIRAYEDATYRGPDPVPGIDFERDRDETGFLDLRVIRTGDSGASLTFQAVSRLTRHRETLVIAGPQCAYSQWLGSLAAELASRPQRAWGFRAGIGIDGAGTPETGDKPARDPIAALAAHLRLTRRLGEATEVFGQVSRRSRFPSLRELYSGALGRFVPNPDLDPEHQNLLELGGTTHSGSLDLGVTGFAGRLVGGIEKVNAEGDERLFQRVNSDRINTLGLEVVVHWIASTHVSATAHHTLLRARRHENAGDDIPVEDRPAQLGYLAVEWRPSTRLTFITEGQLTGERHGADATDARDGLRPLPAQGTVNAAARIRWGPPLGLGFGRGLETTVRIDNIFDQRVDSQVGLPEAGRQVFVGMRIEIDRLERRIPGSA
jgi:iron complex outermembrane receptor protein